MPSSLNESIAAVVATLPASPMLYEDFRTATMKGSIENAQPALAYILKNKDQYAKLELKPLNTETNTLILTPEQAKKPDGSPVPYKHVLTICKL